MSNRTHEATETPAAKVNWNVVPMADSPNTGTAWHGLLFRDPANIPKESSYGSTTFRRACWIVIAFSVPMALLCLVALAK